MVRMQGDRGARGNRCWPEKWPETVVKAVRKFAAIGDVLYRLIVGEGEGGFLRPLLTQLRQSMS